MGDSLWVIRCRRRTTTQQRTQVAIRSHFFDLGEFTPVGLCGALKQTQRAHTAREIPRRLGWSRQSTNQREGTRRTSDNAVAAAGNDWYCQVTVPFALGRIQRRTAEHKTAVTPIRRRPTMPSPNAHNSRYQDATGLISKTCWCMGRHGWYLVQGQKSRLLTTYDAGPSALETQLTEGLLILQSCTISVCFRVRP